MSSTSKALIKSGSSQPEAVVREYDAAVKEIEALGKELSEAAKKCEAMVAGVHAMVAEIKELAARYRDEGKRYFLQIEDCSLMTSEVRTVCEALKKKIAADNIAAWNSAPAVPAGDRAPVVAVCRWICPAAGGTSSARRPARMSKAFATLAFEHVKCAVGSRANRQILDSADSQEESRTSRSFPDRLQRSQFVKYSWMKAISS